MSKRRTPNNSLLIVCEDQNTATEYLHRARLLSLQGGFWSRVEICPAPPSERESSPSKADKRSGENKKRPSRQIKNASAWNPPDNSFAKALLERYNMEEAEERYKKYCAQPLCYVAEAAELGEGDAYTSKWAVFDKDGHVAHEKAWEYATENGVNIAFSSVSFEHWLLLHFEYNSTAFAKSDDAEKQLARYLPNYAAGKRAKRSKSTVEDMDIAFPHWEMACLRAAWLRYVTKASEATEIFNRNPYSNTDELLCEMLHCRRFVWTTGKGEEINLPQEVKFRLLASLQPNNSAILEISYRARQRFAPQQLRAWTWQQRDDYRTEAATVVESAKENANLLLEISAPPANWIAPLLCLDFLGVVLVLDIWAAD